MTDTQTNIGRWAKVLVDDMQSIGTVMDLMPGTQTPKRIRLQRGPNQGSVVMPSGYEFLGWLDECDIDE